MSEATDKWSELGNALLKAGETASRAFADFFAAWNENIEKENN